MLLSLYFLGGCTVFKIEQKFNHALKRGLALYLTLASVNVFAENDAELSFIVQPKICVLAAFETHCKDKIELSWTSTTKRSLCVYSVKEDNNDYKESADALELAGSIESQEPLKCWDNTLEGVHELSIDTQYSINFYLKDIEKERLLTSQSFKVLHDTQRYRRRHRNPWSFF